VQLNLKDFVESANEHHMEAWANIITNSSPPVPNTPLTAYLDTTIFQKQGTAFSNAKIKRVIGYKIRRPKFTAAELDEVINSFKNDGIWPIDAE
jgi:hypothetical protein